MIRPSVTKLYSLLIYIVCVCVQACVSVCVCNNMNHNSDSDQQLVTSGISYGGFPLDIGADWQIFCVCVSESVRPHVLVYACVDSGDACALSGAEADCWTDKCVHQPDTPGLRLWLIDTTERSVCACVCRGGGGSGGRGSTNWMRKQIRIVGAGNGVGEGVQQDRKRERLETKREYPERIPW